MLKKVLQRARFIVGTRLSRNFTFTDSMGKARDFVHRGTRPDRNVIKDIFLRTAYSTQGMARHAFLTQAYNSILGENKIPLIIDAGANIGASAVWFANAFPKSYIVAIEPEIDNYRLLARNSGGLNIEPVKAAIGSTDGFASVVDPGRGEWGYQTVNNATGECRRVAIRSLLAEKIQAGSSPFILKVDIEGGEDDLFEGDASWVDEFPLIVIELHDWMLPGQKTSHSFLKAIAPRDRDLIIRGENVFSFRN
jgi:FkbM family methyltransferase